MDRQIRNFLPPDSAASIDFFFEIVLVAQSWNQWMLLYDVVYKKNNNPTPCLALLPLIYIEHPLNFLIMSCRQWPPPPKKKSFPSLFEPELKSPATGTTHPTHVCSTTNCWWDGKTSYTSTSTFFKTTRNLCPPHKNHTCCCQQLTSRSPETGTLETYSSVSTDGLRLDLGPWIWRRIKP